MQSSPSVKTYPVCPKCGRKFTPGTQWYGINFCRATLLLEAIYANPGLSTAELAGITGLVYGQAVKGMEKVRSYGDEIVTLEAEVREAGGTRYRYWAQEGWEKWVEEWAVQVAVGKPPSMWS